jgi:hypothetical protein
MRVSKTGGWAFGFAAIDVGHVAWNELFDGRVKMRKQNAERLSMRDELVEDRLYCASFSTERTAY